MKVLIAIYDWLVAIWGWLAEFILDILPALNFGLGVVILLVLVNK